MSDLDDSIDNMKLDLIKARYAHQKLKGSLPEHKLLKSKNLVYSNKEPQASRNKQNSFKHASRSYDRNVDYDSYSEESADIASMNNHVDYLLDKQRMIYQPYEEKHSVYDFNYDGPIKPNCQTSNNNSDDKNVDILAQWRIRKKMQLAQKHLNDNMRVHHDFVLLDSDNNNNQHYHTLNQSPYINHHPSHDNDGDMTPVLINRHSLSTNDRLPKEFDELPMKDSGNQESTYEYSIRRMIYGSDDTFNEPVKKALTRSISTNTDVQLDNKSNKCSQINKETQVKVQTRSVKMQTRSSRSNNTFYKGSYQSMATQTVEDVKINLLHNAISQTVSKQLFSGEYDDDVISDVTYIDSRNGEYDARNHQHIRRSGPMSPDFSSTLSTSRPQEDWQHNQYQREILSTNNAIPISDNQNIDPNYLIGNQDSVENWISEMIDKETLSDSEFPDDVILQDLRQRRRHNLAEIKNLSNQLKRCQSENIQANKDAI